MMEVFIYFILVLCVLISVAFVTLLERKILGYLQLRKGPTKVGPMGVLQPFADAVKLFSKENNFLIWFNKFMYFLSPMLSLLLMLMFWSVTMVGGEIFIFYSLIMVMIISSCGVYTILMSGWSSNSKYSLLGAYRGIVQTISYEVGMSFILMGILYFGFSYNLIYLNSMQGLLSYVFGLTLVFLMWMVIILAETNRTPFDFAEGESELVSGFNTEYGASGFAVLFMAEYGNILFMSYLTSIIFFYNCGPFMVVMMFICVVFLWLRGTLARFRYDNLMYLSWKVVLPFTIYFLFISLMLKTMFNSFLLSHF